MLFMKTTACSVALFACVALLTTPAHADAVAPQPPPLRLVGAVLSTGQALVWDSSVEAYALLRLGQRYNGYVVQRLLADRIVLSHERRVVELRLARAPVVSATARRTEQRGAPAVIITGERQVASKPAPALPPPAIPAVPAPAAPALPAPPASPAPPAPPAARPLPRRALPELPPDPPTAPPAPAPVKLQEVRSEVSAFIQGQRSYRGSFARSGGVLLDGVAAGSLLQRLGLRDGDLVLSVGGVKLGTRDAAMNAYLAMTSGKVVDVVLIRNGRRQTLRLNLS
jgi:hypothetical protein